MARPRRPPRPPIHRERTSSLAKLGFPHVTELERIERLQPREGRLRVVIDTDTFNEVDDQFALAYALRSLDRLSVDAIYAAPFTNERAANPANGMAQSYDEILRLLSLMGRSASGLVYRGSEAYIGPALQPQRSDAAIDLVDRAMAAAPENPLYVIGLAAVSNIASALLIEPKIMRNIVVVWLGGHAPYWPDTNEFNLRQDVSASRLLLDCGVPLVLIPCNGVARVLSTTVPELERYVEPTGALGAFLTETVRDYREKHVGWSKPIWDIAAVAYLINPSWVPSDLIHSPVLTDDVTWSVDTTRHLIRCARFVERNKIFADVFKKLAHVPAA